MIRKYKGKPLTVPLAASVIAFGLALSGCDDKTVTQANASTTVAPKSTVSGLVQDTNGAPLQGFTVSLLGKKTTTDASGTYVFTNVAVTAVAGADGSVSHIQDLSVVITPPTGSNYIGAVVTVRPEAQIDGNGDDHAANLASRLLTGFNVAAGTAVLPSRTSTVNGVLRNEVTGEPVAGVKVALDLEAAGSGAAVGQEQPQNGATTTYNAPAMFTTTGADGSFSFANVPGDSTLRLQAENWTLSGNCPVNTDDEEVILNLGTCNASPIVSADNIDPVIVKVQDAIGLVLNLDDNGEVAALNLTLSEVVTGDLTVPGAAYVAVNGQYVSGTFSLVGSKVVNFVPDAPIAEGSFIRVSILRSALADVAGNYLTDDNGVVDVFTNDYLGGNGNEYVQLDLIAGSNPVGGAVTPTQFLGTAQTGDLLALGVGNDVLGGGNTEYLDSIDQDQGGWANDAFMRVDDLLDEAGLTPDIDSTTTARVQWAINNSVNYSVVRLRDGWSNSYNNGDAVSGMISVDFNDAEPGDLIQVTATDALGAQFTSVVELVDHVGPIPVLQDAYVYQDVLTTQSVVAGDGGELYVTTTGNTLVGPVFPVNRGLLTDPQTYAQNGGSARDARNFGFEDFIVGGQIIMAQDDYQAATGDAMYESGSAATAWLASRNVEMGIAFSEDITLVGTPSYTGSASLSGWMVANDITQDLIGNNVNVDLAVFTGNPVTMQADHNDSFNFGGAVADASGNLAPSTNVIVRDVLPPFVTAGSIGGGDGVAYDPLDPTTIYDDTEVTLTLTFNEAIAPAAELQGKSIDLRGENGNLKISIALDFTGGGNATLVSPTTLQVDFVPPFVDGDELGLTAATNRVDYYTVDFSQIPDAVTDENGNYNNYWGVHGGWLGTPHAIITYQQ